MKQVNKQRWDIAQKSELDFWKEYVSSSFDMSRYNLRCKEKLNRLLKIWNNYIVINKNTRILDIGGPIDIINQFKTGKLFSIEPLADYFKSNFKFNYKLSNIIRATGEEIPFPDKYFDLVIINNVIDHTHFPEKVLDEIHRVLKDNGIMNLEVNVYLKSFLFLSKVYGFFKKIFTREIFNIHHPYMFKSKEIDDMVEKRFIILNKRIEDKEKSKETMKNLRLRIVKKFGILGSIHYALICKKKKGN